MNVDTILDNMNRHKVRYLLIGGMNFLLRHRPILTFDVDLWIEDSEPNRQLCHSALVSLAAEWGKSDADWGPVKDKSSDWLSVQHVFCLTSPHGAIDIFRSVRGLASWSTCFAESVRERTAGAVSYYGICDRDMLACQRCLPREHQKLERIAALEQALAREPRDE
ncbi:MAG: hypothetical protein O2931_06375 [Planctomycetota bacterium]|nr:hypothetical protein [Planctomycetota bacterium]MDA1178407.1 hypothetical protein [Planctomycetota bacterium]